MAKNDALHAKKVANMVARHHNDFGFAASLTDLFTAAPVKSCVYVVPAQVQRRVPGSFIPQRAIRSFLWDEKEVIEKLAARTGLVVGLWTSYDPESDESVMGLAELYEERPLDLVGTTVMVGQACDEMLVDEFCVSRPARQEVA